MIFKVKNNNNKVKNFGMKLNYQEKYYNNIDEIQTSLLGKDKKQQQNTNKGQALFKLQKSFQLVKLVQTFVTALWSANSYKRKSSKL